MSKVKAHTFHPTQPREIPMIDRMQLTAQVVTAYIGNNHLQPAALPDLIRSVHDTLAMLGQPPAAPAAKAPAVDPKKSIHQEFIICLEDGKRFKSLKRHLMTYYGLTPEAYRAKWALPGDYPMVAPAYATRRSALATKAGLGRRPRLHAVA
jgi:predicted transcriptional regulator